MPRPRRRPPPATRSNTRGKPARRPRRSWLRLLVDTHRYASALADGNYLFDQPLQRRVALALRQADDFQVEGAEVDRKSTRLNSSHSQISDAVFFLKKKI